MERDLSASRRENLSGIGFMTLGIASFSLMDAIGKSLVSVYSTFQILAVRSTMVTLVLLAVMPVFGGRSTVASRQPWAHSARSLCSVVAFFFFFTAVRFLPLADAVAVAFGGPFIVTALAVPLLGEHVTARRWAAVAVGFFGMLLIVQPSGQGFRPAGLLVVASSVSYALMMIMTRWMHRRVRSQEKTFTFVFYTFAIQAASGWLGVAPVWRTMEIHDLGLVFAMGALALGGHIGITLAFQHAPVSVVAPFEYTALIWATLLGFVVFGEFPEAEVWLGVAIIVAAGLYTIRGENSEAEEQDPVG